jgi:hypothetical protein
MRLELSLICALLLGCEAQIFGSDGGPPPDSSGLGTPTAGATGGSGSFPVSGPSDDDLRAKDPELFEIAKQYFPGETATPGKKRLFRLTREQLDATTASLLPGHAEISARATLPRDPLQTNYEYSDNLGFSAANFTPLTKWVDELSALVLLAPTSVVDCSAGNNDQACLEQGARSFVERAFRGIVSESQLARFASFYSASASEVGIEQASADLVNVTLTSPGYLFRDEVLTDSTGKLLPAQLLQNLSYTLADAPPEAVGLKVPGKDVETLADADVASAVQSVLATDAARRKLLRFFTTWLEVKEPQDFDISPLVFPEFTPEVAQAVVQDTQNFLEKQLSLAIPRLRDVTEATSAFASGSTTFLYGAGTGTGELALDPTQRLGIFSQPAVIASHSGPTTTRLVKRGVFFTRKVMCLPLGVPPADVNTTLPENTEGTERERIESVTTPARCAGCHNFINPFGFMQESYDAIGRYRTQDNGKPVDTSISVDFLDEGQLTATSAVEALRGFTRSLRFQQCFTRQLFRFYQGRDEVAGDDPLLRQLFFEFAQNDSQDIVQMLKSLASSSLFHARQEAP